MNDLHDLFHDAVDHIEPADRLGELRARTTSPQRAAARPWWWAAGATVLATAAAVAVVAVVSDGSDAPGHHHHDMAMDPPASTQLVAAYFIGGSPDGPRLFREFDQVPVGDPLQGALDRIERPPSDRDYSTPWDAGSFTGASVDHGVITVDIGEIDTSVDASQLGVQQVIYTVQAAVGDRLPVRFVGDDGSVYMGPMGAADPAQVLNPVSISDPAEGDVYAGSMIARGRVLTDQPAVPWRIANDHMVFAEGTAVITGERGGFRPWEVDIDLSGLDPGTYAFTALSYSDAGYGADPPTDTRTIIVR